MKFCPHCGETKPPEDFGKSPSWCLECKAKNQRTRMGGYRVGPRGRNRQLPKASGQRRCLGCGGVFPYESFNRGPNGYRVSRCCACIKIRRDAIRDEVLVAYGGKCVCCGEAERVFLAIDHVNNDGAAHRKTAPANARGGFMEWLKRKGFPSGFQILCHNCNMAKHLLGACPHQSR